MLEIPTKESNMSRVAPLTDNKIKSARPREKKYKLADGDGLYLTITPQGSKRWEYIYKIDKKQSSKAIGSYPTITLKEARVKRDEYRKMLAEGQRPRDSKGNGVTKSMVFKDLMEEYHKHHDELSARYIKDNTNMLERDFSSILNKSLDDITIEDLLECFKAMEKRGLKSAPKKAGSLLTRMFKYAVTLRHTDNNPMASIDLTVLLKKHTPKNFPHTTDPKVLKGILYSIQEGTMDIYTKTALTFMPYAFLRPANIREMLWAEIDFGAKTWTIPASKMKMKKDHVVPLTPRMISILKSSPSKGKSKYVFPSPQTNFRPMSDNTLNVALKRLGYKDIMTSHGFRHTASTMLHENIHNHGIPSDVIEMQLAHVDSHSVRGVYNKALYMKERIALMQWWSDYLESLSPGE